MGFLKAFVALLLMAFNGGCLAVVHDAGEAAGRAKNGPADSVVFHSLNEALIDQTCKQTPSYDLCVSSLKSDGRSTTADVTGLAIIIVDKTKDLATKTLNKIQQLLSKKPSGQKEKALRSCSGQYNAILSADIPVAIEALTKGNPKFAENSETDAANEATACENGFAGDSPLANENKAVHDIATIGAAIVHLLL